MQGLIERLAYPPVFGNVKPEGRSRAFDCRGAAPDAEQLARYAALIRGLRDLPYEHIIFDFSDKEGWNGFFRGLAFYQLCAAFDGLVHAEVAIDTESGRTMYGTECGREEAIALMNRIFETRTAPDVSGWEDITHHVFVEEPEERKSRDAAQRLLRIGRDLHLGLTSGVPDPDAAIPRYAQAAAQGDPQAMVGLGMICEERNDYERACYWYNEAALAGDDDGLFNLANLYHLGRYVAQDHRKAYAYFERLYRRYCPGAAFYLGLYHEHGLAVERDHAAALRFYREGLAFGGTYCAVNLGRMVSLGLGTTRDEKRGYALYEQGYLAGDPLACANLGYCHETGLGAAFDREKALAFYREGAELGEAHCAEALARLSPLKCG